MGKTDRITIPGLNVQWPWSDLIASGTKTIETRGYPLPTKYLKRPVAIIATKGKGGGPSESCIVAVVLFSSHFKYRSKSEWLRDSERHLVKEDDQMFAFSPTKDKWGWEIERVCKVSPPVRPPKKRGIKFALACNIPSDNLSGRPADIARFIKSK